MKYLRLQLNGATPLSSQMFVVVVVVFASRHWIRSNVQISMSLDAFTFAYPL